MNFLHAIFEAAARKLQSLKPNAVEESRLFRQHVASPSRKARREAITKLGKRQFGKKLKAERRAAKTGVEAP